MPFSGVDLNFYAFAFYLALGSSDQSLRCQRLNVSEFVGGHGGGFPSGGQDVHSAIILFFLAVEIRDGVS